MPVASPGGAIFLHNGTIVVAGAGRVRLEWPLGVGPRRLAGCKRDVEAEGVKAKPPPPGTALRAPPRRRAPHRIRVAWLAGVAAAALSIGAPAGAFCKTPLPTPELRALDALVARDPQASIDAAHARLGTLAASAPLVRAELFAIVADGYDSIEDDAKARQAVADARRSLAALAPTPAVRDLELRLDLVLADASESAAELASAIKALDAWEPRLAAGTLGRACLLLVRGRALGRANEQERAARDGLLAYQIASAQGAADAASEAAYQLSTTFRRAGLFAEAERMADEAVRYAHATGERSAEADALYAKAEILSDNDRAADALPVLTASEAISATLNDRTGVAFAELERCRELFTLGQTESAGEACRRADAEFVVAGRADQHAAALALLARIDLRHGRAHAALQRLDEALADDGANVPPLFLEHLYRYRSDALAATGRKAEALAALQRSVQFGGLEEHRRSSLAVALLSAQQASEREARQREALGRALVVERERARARDVARRLALGLAAAGLVASALFGYLLLLSRRHAQALRREETILREASTNDPDAIALLDATGRVRFANRCLFGTGVAPDVGRPIAAGVPPAARAPIEAAVAELVAGCEIAPFDVTLAGARGTRRFELRGLPIMDHGRLLGATLRSSDVTELRLLEQTVLQTDSIERQRLSRDLHEGLGQEIAGVSMLLRAAVTAARRGRGDALDTVAESIGQLDRMVASTRDLARDLSPVRIEQGSLSTALARLAHDAGRRFGTEVAATSEPADIHASEFVSDHVYRIADEAVGAAISAGGCRHVALDLEQRAETLQLSVTGDGGRLAAMAADAHGAAAKSIAYRARLLGAALSVGRLDDGRTRVVLSVPRRFDA